MVYAIASSKVAAACSRCRGVEHHLTRAEGLTFNVWGSFLYIIRGIFILPTSNYYFKIVVLRKAKASSEEDQLYVRLHTQTGGEVVHNRRRK